MKFLLLITILFTFSMAEESYREEPVYYVQVDEKQVAFELAVKYALGTEVRKNERKAFNLFHKSARKGHLEATYLMGVCFDQGRGVKIQKSLARYWFKLAAKQGHEKAMFRLARVEKSLNIKLSLNNKYLPTIIRR